MAKLHNKDISTQKQSVDISNGNTLKARRQALKLSIEQVAADTYIRSNIIADIEADNDLDMPERYKKSFTDELNNFYNKLEHSGTDSLKIATIAADDSSVIISKESDLFDADANAQTIASETPQYTKNEYNEHSTNTKNTTEERSLKIEHNDSESLTFTITDTAQTHNDVDDAVKINRPINTEEVDIPTTSAHQHKQYVKTSSPVTSKRLFKNSLNLSIGDLLIYAVIVAFLIGVLYFVFFYNKSDNSTIPPKLTKPTTTDTENVTNVSDKQLLNYFEAKDSIVLRAKCKDSAWVKVEIDNKKVDELMMIPGMEKRWNAGNNIILTTTNVGGVLFYKNDTLLPPLGPTGTMVRNIRFTTDGLSNVAPLEEGNAPVSVNNTQPNLTPITPSVADTSKIVKRTIGKRKKKKNAPPPAPILDFSKPTTIKPSVLENENKEKEKQDNK